MGGARNFIGLWVFQADCLRERKSVFCVCKVERGEVNIHEKRVDCET